MWFDEWQRIRLKGINVKSENWDAAAVVGDRAPPPDADDVPSKATRPIPHLWRHQLIHKAKKNKWPALSLLPTTTAIIQQRRLDRGLAFIICVLMSKIDRPVRPERKDRWSARVIKRVERSQARRLECVEPYRRNHDVFLFSEGRRTTTWYHFMLPVEDESEVWL
jgi:hypothetical protein